MKFLLDAKQDNVIVRYHDQSVEYSVTQLKRSKLIEADKDLFAEINQYIQTLDQTIQFGLFECMREINQLRYDDLGVSYHVQLKETREQLKTFYTLLDLASLEVWIKRHRHLISIPTDLISKDSEEAKSSNHNVNINYYLEDYDGLIFLVLALRPMIPIWGDYIQTNKDTVGSKHKEYQAFKLLELTPLVHCHQLERLRFYIAETRATNASKKMLSSDAAVLEGISSDSLNEYLLATVLVRKVALTNVNNSIISSIYSYLKNKISEASETFKISPKHAIPSYEDSPRDRSKLENYKISASLTYGTIEFIRSYIRDPYTVAKHVDPTIDLNILENCLDTNRRLTQFRIQDHMVLLTQWLISSVFPANGVYELNRNEMLDLISVCQAILIHWQIEGLPLLITGRIEDALFAEISTTRANIEESLLDQLEIIFPYKKPGKLHKRANLAFEAINKFTHRLLTRYFHITPPQCYIERFGDVPRMIECPLNVVNQVAYMVIKTNSITR